MPPKRNKKTRSTTSCYELVQPLKLPKLLPDFSATKTAFQMASRRQYFFIDFTEQGCCRPLQRINMDLIEEDEGEKIGRSVVVNLGVAPLANKINQYSKMSERLSLRKNELRQRIRTKLQERNEVVNEKPQMKAHQTLDAAPSEKRSIARDKERKLRTKLGIVSAYQSIEEPHTESYDRCIGKAAQYFLPPQLRPYMQVRD